MLECSKAKHFRGFTVSPLVVNEGHCQRITVNK